MASAAEALSNAGRRFIFRQSEQPYVRRVTLSGRYAVLRDEPAEAMFEDVKPPWLTESASALIELTRLPHDWDLEGGEPVDPVAAKAAYSVILRLAQTMEDRPDVVPVGDGGVMVEWHDRLIDLEIEIEPNLEGSIFFRDRIHDRIFQSTRLSALLGPHAVGLTVSRAHA